MLSLQLEEAGKTQASLQTAIEELRCNVDVSAGQLTDRERQLQVYKIHFTEIGLTAATRVGRQNGSST